MEKKERINELPASSRISPPQTTAVFETPLPVVVAQGVEEVLRFPAASSYVLVVGLEVFSGQIFRQGGMNIPVLHREACSARGPTAFSANRWRSFFPSIFQENLGAKRASLLLAQR